MQSAAANQQQRCRASLSIDLKIRPRALSDEFWECFTGRVWLFQDTIVSMVTVLFLPFMYKRSPDWGLLLTYILVYILKAFHVVLLYRATMARRAGSLAGQQQASRIYTFRRRSLFIIAERLLRMASSYFVGRDFEKHQARLHLLASVSGRAAALRTMAEATKRVFMGTGTTVLFWHVFCLPTVWALESALLLPLVIMTLYGRGPPTAAFIASFPPGSAVHALKSGLASICSNACRAALPINHTTSSMCNVEDGSSSGGGGGGALQLEMHLIATLIIFVQYLGPLYCRYLQEQSVKREYVWPHLSVRHKASFLVYHCSAGSWRNVALTAVLHTLALVYLLAVSFVLGRLAARHLMPLRLQVLLQQGLIQV